MSFEEITTLKQRISELEKEVEAMDLLAISRGEEIERLEAISKSKYREGFKNGHDCCINQLKDQKTKNLYLDRYVLYLQSREAKLVEVVKFYACKKNWDDRWIEDTDDGGDIFDVINRDDVEICDDPKSDSLDETWLGHYTHGGKRARELLKSLGME